MKKILIVLVALILIGVVFIAGSIFTKTYRDASRFNNNMELAKSGNVQAAYDAGMMLDLGIGIHPNSSEAVKWLLLAAEKGHAHAQYKLGCLYDQGKGIAQSHEEAFKWKMKSAEQEYVLAEYDVAGKYFYAEGTTKNDAKALKWLQQAAQQDYKMAQYNLAVFYKDGIAVQKDPVQAYIWFALAKTKFPEHILDVSEEAKRTLQEMRIQMTKEQQAQAEQIYQAWKPEIKPISLNIVGY